MAVRRTRVLLVVTGVVGVLLGAAVSTTFSDDSAPSDWTAPHYATRKANPVPSTPDSIAAGKAVYMKNCLACHGMAGKGDGPAAFALNPKPRDLSDPKIAAQSDGSMFWKITQGKKPMPSFETLTTETERWEVINYVRTLEPQGTPSSQPASAPN